METKINKCELSIIIVSWNVANMLRDCLKSIYENTKGHYEIIVLDNNSFDESVSMVKREFPEVILIEKKENLGFLKGVNEGFNIAKGKYIMLLNPDTIIIDDAINKMLSFLKLHPEIGTIGPKLLNKDGSIYRITKNKLPTIRIEIMRLFLIKKIIDWFKGRLRKISFFRKKFDLFYEKSEETEYLEGSCVLCKKSLFDAIGEFDESAPFYIADLDMSYMTRKMGLKNFYFADAKVIHIGGQSVKQKAHYKINDVLKMYTSLLYYKKHYGNKTAFAYKLIVAFSIPYLLLLDIITLPYVLFKGKLNEKIWVIKKHLKYVELLVHDKIAIK